MKGGSGLGLTEGLASLDAENDENDGEGDDDRGADDTDDDDDVRRKVFLLSD